MIWGYGTEQNEAQLLEDGWLVYEGSLPLYMLEYSDGQIVESPPEGYRQSTAVEPYELEAQDLTGTQICTTRKLSRDYLDDVWVIRLLQDLHSDARRRGLQASVPEVHGASSRRAEKAGQDE
jgi:hypothetical protein